ncbi:WD40 repeat and Utp12 domain-containing protein [Aspergillus udagawae]|uniref:Small subunit (SSU) processome component n=1 Tax=Aspergillus udagawae TaxID=91492 RepID=A0A8E0QUS0_9EURO|nr:small subunit (SSU) processome component [Aspergillus udagawae]GIC90845.1 small subunit (SSU) processome component [Aspergillus udagawae]
MGKKAPRPPVSKTSSAASPAVSGLTYTGNKSSILKASFAPSEYQLALFASVIQGLDAQHLRIHDTNTGRLQCEHVLGPKETVTSLDWGYFPLRQRDRDQQGKKKRKRHSDINGASSGFEQGDVVVAFGTNASEIRMYSPIEDKIVGALGGVHDKGVVDFKFTANRPGQEGWSIGGDNKLVQWDLRTGKSTRTIHLPASTGYSTLSRPVPSNPPVVCASQTPYLIDVEGDESTASFPAMRNQIREIITSSTESLTTAVFLASDGDRYINVFDVEGRKLVLNLVADTEVSSLALTSGSGQGPDDALAMEKQILAAVTEDGTIELFTKPLVPPKDQSSKTSLKARGRQLTRRAESSIKITQSETSDASVPVVAATFQGTDILIVWAEGGIIPVFERINCIDIDTEELAFTGLKKIVKTKSSSVLASVTTNGIRAAGETQVDESRAVVEQGDLVEDDVEMQDTRADATVADSEEDSEDDDDDSKKPVEKKETRQRKQKKDADSDVEMRSEAGDEEDAEEDETGEPSFGELLRANASEEIDVEAELEDDVRIGSLVPGKPSAAVQQITSGVTLSTVLTQSLKTNDNGMLESCFHTGDLTIVRETIQRLDSSLAATLLQKLAERLSSRPGRYGHLLVWVQWTCVAHGGALAGKPELLKRMSTLFKVMDQRSSSLSSLLLLKGKLDMLHAQLGLRQSLRGGAEGMDSEDEDNIIYVEGQEELEDEDSDADTAKNAVTPRTKSIRDQTYDEDESMIDGEQSGRDESDDEEDEGSDEEDENEEDVFDVEAEESVGSSDAEESLEDEDEEEDDDAESAGSMADFIADTEDDESDDDGLSAQPPPSKKAKFGGSGGKEKKSGRR